MDCSIRFKLHDTVTFGKKSEIVPASDKMPSMKFTAPLTDNNTSRTNKLTAIRLDT